MTFTFAGEYAGDVLYKTKGSAGGVSVAVADLLGSPAVLYTDRTKAAQTGSSTVTTDPLGNVAFFAEPGTYTCSVLNGGTFTAVVPLDPAELTGDLSGFATASSLTAEAARATAAEGTLATGVAGNASAITAEVTRAGRYVGAPTPMSQGYVGWASDFAGNISLGAVTGTSYPAGVLRLQRVDVVPSVSVNGFISFTWTNIAGMANTFFSVYTISGSTLTLVGSTANLSSHANGFDRVAVSGFTSTPASGVLYVGYLNGTSGVAGGPRWCTSAWSSTTPLLTSLPPGNGQTRFCITGVSLTAPPGSVSLTGAGTSNLNPWIALD